MDVCLKEEGTTVKVEYLENGITISLDQSLRESTIAQQGLKIEPCDDVEFLFEERTGNVGVPRNDKHQVTVKFEEEEVEMSNFNLPEAEEKEIKEENTVEYSVTLPLVQAVQPSLIAQRCLKTEPSTSCDQVECQCEECTGGVWVQGEGGQGVNVKLERDDGSVSQPMEVGSCDKPSVSILDVPTADLPADNIDSFFDDAEENFDKELHEEATIRTSNPRPYVCLICGTDFNQKGSLKMHLLIHSGVKPYHCHICGKDFIQKGALKTHLKVHDPERRQAQCADCGAPFSRAYELVRHQVDNCCPGKKPIAPEPSVSHQVNYPILVINANQENNWRFPIGQHQFVASVPLTGTFLAIPSFPQM